MKLKNTSRHGSSAYLNSSPPIFLSSSTPIIRADFAIAFRRSSVRVSKSYLSNGIWIDSFLRHTGFSSDLVFHFTPASLSDLGLIFHRKRVSEFGCQLDFEPIIQASRC